MWYIGADRGTEHSLKETNENQNEFLLTNKWAFPGFDPFFWRLLIHSLALFGDAMGWIEVSVQHCSSKNDDMISAMTDCLSLCSKFFSDNWIGWIAVLFVAECLFVWLCSMIRSVNIYIMDCLCACHVLCFPERRCVHYTWLSSLTIVPRGPFIGHTVWIWGNNVHLLFALWIPLSPT